MVSPLADQAISMASLQCQNKDTLDWLREIISRSENETEYKGSIYAIPYSSGLVFLHQPWISSCFGCILYSCEGQHVSLSEGEKNEIMAGAKAENLIYSSTY